MTAAIVAAAALAFPVYVLAGSLPAAAATPAEASTVESTVTPEATAVEADEGAVGESFETTPFEALLYWTPARLAEAEPLEIPTLPGPTPASEGASASSPTEATAASGSASAPTAAATSATLSRRAAVEGLPSTSTTAFPDRANGKIFAVYEVDGEFRGFECSGSVVHSSPMNVVLTAGHCVINPETGERAKFLIFIPGYREHSEPYGRWAAQRLAVPEAWAKTAKPGSIPNEGADLAMLEMRSSQGTRIEERVGGLGIAFDQACIQTYTQYGYPGDFPYDGELLYSHTTAYAGADTNLQFSPEPIKIATDFTEGASGGPWTIGPSTSPTVVSVTDYGYETEPGFLYGAYFGEGARAVYEKASGDAVAPGIEEACKPLPPPSPPTESPPASTTPTPTPVKKKPTLKVKRIRTRPDGSAVVTAKVSSAGSLKLTGSAVRADSLKAPNAGSYRLVVAPRGVASRKLRRSGGAKVGVKISFASSGAIRRVIKKIHLSRR